MDRQGQDQLVFEQRKRRQVQVVTLNNESILLVLNFSSSCMYLIVQTDAVKAVVFQYPLDLPQFPVPCPVVRFVRFLFC